VLSFSGCCSSHSQVLFMCGVFGLKWLLVPLTWREFIIYSCVDSGFSELLIMLDVHGLPVSIHLSFRSL
jgi:hypothetical protein